MLHTIFRDVMETSIAASIIVVIIVAVRMFLKRFPKVFSYILWTILLIRFVIPFSFEISYREIPALITGANEVSQVDSYSVTYIEPAHETLQIKESIFPYVWLGGILLLCLYHLISYIRLKKRLLIAAPYNMDEDIYVADNICVPFVIGAMNPKVYLPSSLQENEIDYILLHEQHHIRRKDHIIKVIMVVLLSVYWFHPLIWVAFFLASIDMEMSCDEAVIKKLSAEKQTEYVESLLRLTAGRKLFSTVSIAFGEGTVKGRIKNILKIRKTGAFKMVLVTIFIIGITFVCMLVPKNKTIDHPCEWIERAALSELSCDYVDEEALRDLAYVLTEINKSEFQKYAEYTSEIEILIQENSNEVRLIYGDGVTVFDFGNGLSEGTIWGVKNDNLAYCMKKIKSVREDTIQKEQYEEPWKPTKEDISKTNAKVFAGVSEEDISYLADLVKVLNLELEEFYLYGNRFEAYEDPDAVEWDELDLDKYRTYIKGIEKRIDDTLLKRDVSEMLSYIDLMEEHKDVEALRSLYYKLHDMDYFLFRYGADEMWFYVHDKSLVSTFFDSLHIYK